MFHSVNNLFIWLCLICWLSDFKICDACFLVLLWQALLIDCDMHGHFIAKGLEGMSMAVRISWRQSTRFSKKLMINAVYHDNPLIFIGATFREKLVSYHWAVNEASISSISKGELVFTWNDVILIMIWHNRMSNRDYTQHEVNSLCRSTKVHFLRLSQRKATKYKLCHYISQVSVALCLFQTNYSREPLLNPKHYLP